MGFTVICIGYVLFDCHGKVIRSNENFLTTRVMAELICADESGKTEIGRVWRCYSREPVHACSSGRSVVRVRDTDHSRLVYV